MLATGGLAVVVLRDDGSGSGDGGYEPEIREELLDGVQPNPECPDAPEAPVPAAGEVVVTAVRVVDGCLAYSGEAVAEDQVDDRLRELRADPEVVAADQAVDRTPGSERSRAGRTGEDPAEQWALAPEHLDGAKARELWPADAPEVRVAMIDTGIDETHRDLADQIVERAPWVHRIDGKYKDHGTHVSGIVAAADDGAGVVGLTPAAKLMDVQYYDTSDDYFAGPSDDLGEYVRWAVDHGADVINMSIQGFEPSDTEATAVLYAERQGVVVVGIAGNCGNKHPDDDVCDGRNEIKYPAGYNTVLSVANHTEDDERDASSSANATVDVAAPGTDIVSDCLTDADGGGDRRRTCEETGTSMAAPFVAATAALLRARHPDAPPAAIREAITRSARPAEGQPEGKRTDAFGWGLLDPAAAAAYLDENPGGSRPEGSGSHERTRVVYVDAEAGQLMVLDDGIPHPVRAIADDDIVDTVDWSGDRSQLVGATDTALFSWTGPGSQPTEVPCDGCEVAFLDLLGGLIATVGPDGTITRYDAGTLEPLGSAKMALPAPDLPIVLRGDTGRALLVGHATDPAASGPDELWLVDPISGEPLDSHAAPGNTSVSEVAVDASGDRVTYLGAQSMDTCGEAERVYLLDVNGGQLEEVAQAPLPTSDLGVLEVEDIFFNGDSVYATFIANEPGDGTCFDVASAGVWRLDADSATWEQIDDAAVSVVRPVEGLTGDPTTGKVTIDYESREGHFIPTGSDGAEQAALGQTFGYLWSTPTSTEVDLAREGSPPPIDSGGGGSGTTETTEPGGGGEGGSVPNTTEAAVARFEDFLHALGAGDVDTMCEIAGPAAAIAEQEGFGDCHSTFTTMLGMISPEQKAALATATIDVDQVSALGGRVEIPAAAIVADVTFTESDLGDSTLAYQDGNWFVVE